MIGIRRRNMVVSEILDGNTDALVRWQPPWTTVPMAEAQRMIVSTIERMEHLTGGNGLLAGVVLDSALRRAAADRPVRILEVATGSGWLIRNLADLAERSGVDVDLTASDVNPDLVEAVRQRFLDDEVPAACTTADAADLDGMEQGEFHAAVMSMSLHHLPHGVAVAALRELDRVSDGGMVVIDIRRNVFGLGSLPPLALLLAPMSGRAFAVHDTVTSIRRAYTIPELRALLGEAGLADRYEVGPLPGLNPQRLVAAAVTPRSR